MAKRKIIVNENERLDSLNFIGGQIIQDPQKFCFGLDSILLADFVRVNENDIVIDFGCGNGVLCLILAAKSNLKKIIGIDIQKDCVNLAKRNVLLNNLQNKIQIIHADIKNIRHSFDYKFDTVVTNPPYINSGIVSENKAKAIARHEILCSLEDVISNASAILKCGGRFFMVHQSQRLVDIFYLMRKFNLEPKTFCAVHPFINAPSQMILVEGVKNGRSMLKIIPPLIVYDENKNYTPQLNRIYNVD